MEDKYGLRDLEHDFPDEAACLSFVYDALHSRKCSCGGEYRLLSGRRQFQCSRCRFQIAPMAGTIFEKSSTPLRLWFHAIMAFSNAKSGISAKELERELNVTYKCAYRILSLIRKALPEDREPLKGIVETDTAVFGGVQKFKAKSKAHIHERKATIMGAVERGGGVRAEVVENAGKAVTDRFLSKHVALDSRLMSDKAQAYKNVPYESERINHLYGYVRGTVHINTMEAYWSHVKRSIKGTFKSVSKKHLQSYLDAFSFHWSNRRSDRERFSALLGTLLRPAA